MRTIQKFVSVGQKTIVLVLSEFLQVLLVVSRLLLVDAVVSSLENSEFVEEVMLCEKKDTHLIFIKKLKWNCCDFFSNMYHKVAISDTSCLEANTGFFKLLMKGTLGSSTCALTSFFWLLSHVIYLKLTKVLEECLLSQTE